MIYFFLYNNNDNNNLYYRIKKKLKDKHILKIKIAWSEKYIIIM